MATMRMKPTVSAAAALLLIGTLSPPSSAQTRSPAADTPLWPQVHQRVAVDEQRVRDILKQMSLREKVGQLVMAEIRHISPGDLKRYPLGGILNGGGAFPGGRKRAAIQDWVELADRYYQSSLAYKWKGAPIPVIWGTDAVHGHSNVYRATIFPHNIGLGATRNPQLLRAIGKATAAEVAATGLHWTFAPTVAVPRDDRWGRTYEGYGEDPQLVSSLGTAMVLGLQGSGKDFMGPARVLATAKHFIGDGGTYKGVDQGDARVTETRLRQIHGEGYIGTLGVGVQTVMASFNSWNGSKLHGNRYLLTEVLKNKMGFDGLVVGDWNGHGQVPGCDNGNCAAAINAGVDMIMVPEDWEKYFNNTLSQVKKGVIPMARVDDAVSRILRVKLRAGLFTDGGPKSRANAGSRSFVGNASHRALARQAVRESLVLLKNNGNVLPLSPKSRVLVVGEAAKRLQDQMGGWSLTWQGTGNKDADFPDARSILSGISAAVSAAGGRAEYSADGSHRQKPDVAVVVFGEAPYAEGPGDRKDLDFSPPGDKQLRILQTLQKQGIPTVSIFLSGRPMWVNPELNASDSFIAAWLPGSEAGDGIADVLFCPRGKRDCDFSGRLSFSWPARPDQGPLNEGDDKKPLFPFGYGLKYSDRVTVGKLSEQVSRAVGFEKILLRGWPQAPYFVQLQEGQQPPLRFANQQVVTAGGGLRVAITSHRVQEDAQSLSFEGKGMAAWMLAHRSHDNWESAVAAGGWLTMEVRFSKLDGKNPLYFSITCGPGCRASMPFGDRFGKSDIATWRKVNIELACLEKLGLNPATVQMPAILLSAGKWAMDIGEVKLVDRPSGGTALDCPR